MPARLAAAQTNDLVSQSVQLTAEPSRVLTAWIATVIEETGFTAIADTDKRQSMIVNSARGWASQAVNIREYRHRNS